MMNSIKRFVREEDGVTMVEYGLLAALISVVCIVAIKVIGTQLNTVFDEDRYLLDAPLTWLMR